MLPSCHDIAAAECYVALMRFERRAFASFVLAGTSLIALGAPRRTRAALARGLTLPEMVARSQTIAVVTPLEAHSHRQDLGGRLLIVTDTRIRVEEPLEGSTRMSELLVRTLGGQVGDSGELVHGQAELKLGAASVAFLVRAESDLCWVTGMAQGYYPLHGPAGAQILQASRSLPRLARAHGSAVQTLSNQPLLNARRLIRATGTR